MTGHPHPAAPALSWPGFRSEYSWITRRSSPTVTRPHQIGVAFTPHHGAVYERSGRLVEGDIEPGSVFATGRDPITWLYAGSVTEALEIYPDHDLLTAVADEIAPPAALRTLEIEPANAVRDATVLGIGAILKRAHVGDGQLSDVAASTLGHRLAGHVVASYCGVVPSRTIRGGRLDRATVDRVAAYVDAELDERLTLGRLAAVATLSPFHFARAFKASTGLAPHQFVTMWRVERAKALVLGTRLSVPAIARRVGFTNLSHFRRVFRAHTGLTPGELRRAVATRTARLDPAR